MGLQVVILQDEDKWSGGLHTKMENIETWLVDESIDMHEAAKEYNRGLPYINRYTFAQYIEDHCGGELVPFIEFER